MGYNSLFCLKMVTLYTVNKEHKKSQKIFPNKNRDGRILLIKIVWFRSTIVSQARRPVLSPDVFLLFKNRSVLFVPAKEQSFPNNHAQSYVWIGLPKYPFKA